MFPPEHQDKGYGTEALTKNNRTYAKVGFSKSDHIVSGNEVQMCLYFTE